MVQDANKDYGIFLSDRAHQEPLKITRTKSLDDRSRLRRYTSLTYLKGKVSHWFHRENRDTIVCEEDEESFRRRNIYDIIRRDEQDGSEKSGFNLKQFSGAANMSVTVTPRTPVTYESKVAEEVVSEPSKEQRWCANCCKCFHRRLSHYDQYCGLDCADELMAEREFELNRIMVPLLPPKYVAVALIDRLTLTLSISRKMHARHLYTWRVGLWNAILQLLLVISYAYVGDIGNHDGVRMGPIHRTRTCEFQSLWGVKFSDFDALDALETTETQAQWEFVDGCHGKTTAKCWSRSNAVIADGKLSLRAATKDDNSRLSGARVRLSTKQSRVWDGVNHLEFRALLPEDYESVEARIDVQITPLYLTLSLGTLPGSADLWIGSSQNTGILVKLPCTNDIAARFHNFAFAWDENWIRWYVDELMVFEERIQQSKSNVNEISIDVNVSVGPIEGHSTTASSSSSKFKGLSSVLELEHMQLNAGSTNDPTCVPHYRNRGNCREKQPLSPRLGSNQGYLSTSEIYPFINETIVAIPQFARVEEIGQSVENRSILALCIGACHSETPVPQALYTGMHHSREPISTMNLVYTIDILVNDLANGDLQTLYLLFSRQLWFVLIVNPDGYARNEQYRTWELKQMGQRKNTRRGCPRMIDNGVDLNRNYDVCFDYDSVGSSTSICAEDYRGPIPFSEPETQAIRDLVEREDTDFSTALNYHSYGRYFNIPFACESKGTPSEANLTIFNALAREMTHYNHFEYGQPWKDSNLYTVNGETSDWMWQTHRIFAMSPEVGPSFDVPGEEGFWPPRDQVPALSAELHYSNVYAAMVAGPMYHLTIQHMTVTPSEVTINLSVVNKGLRAVESVELLGSLYPNGSYPSPVIKIAANDIGSALLQQNSTNVLRISRRNNNYEEVRRPQSMYLLLRDQLGCHFFRISFDFNPKSSAVLLQQWEPLLFPPCGVCATFGRSTEVSVDARCTTFEDVTTALESVSLRVIGSVNDAMGFGSDGTSLETAITEDGSKRTEGSMRSSHRGQDDHESTSIPASTNSVFESTTISPGTSTVHPNVTVPDTAPHGYEGEANTSSESSKSWRWSFTSISLVPLVALVAGIALLFGLRKLRHKRTATRLPVSSESKTDRAVRKRRVQYARVGNDENADDEEDQSNNDGDDGSDEEDAEYGSRRSMVTRRVRSPSPPPHRPEQTSPSQEDGEIV